MEQGMSEELHAKIAEQAREIAALKANVVTDNSMVLVQALAELERLKAKPGAVVQPERRPENWQTWGDSGDAYNSGVNDTLDEVTRLNASRGPTVPEFDYVLLKIAMQGVKDQLASCEQALQAAQLNASRVPEGLAAVLSDPPSPDAELVELKAVLPLLDDALEHLELHGLHSQQGYRKLRDWYRKMARTTDRIDAKLASLKGEL
jgi:hypothetical protein